jgi:hypothetical protein
VLGGIDTGNLDPVLDGFDGEFPAPNEQAAKFFGLLAESVPLKFDLDECSEKAVNLVFSMSEIAAEYVPLGFDLGQSSEKDEAVGEGGIVQHFPAFNLTSKFVGLRCLWLLLVHDSSPSAGVAWLLLVALQLLHLFQQVAI